MFLHQVSDGSAMHSLTWSTWWESGSLSDQLVHDVISMNIFVLPWAWFKSKSDAGNWGFSPCSVFSTNILSSLSGIVLLWYWKEFTKSFSDEVEVFSVVSDTTGNNKTFFWSDVFHNELLDHSSINVINVTGKTESWHTKSVEAISCSQ